MMTSRKALVAWAAALTTVFGVFVLPFLLPPAPIEALSAANVAGFNNHVAVAAAFLISIGILLAAHLFDLRLSMKPQTAIETTLTPRYTANWAFGMALLLIAVAGFAALADLRYIYDAGYFLEQMQTALRFHRHAYSGVVFEYGPALFYPTIWLSRLLGWLAKPLVVSYIVTLAVHEAIGILLLGYVMNYLPIEPRLRRWMFVACAACVVPVGLGLNYTLLRFLAPAALLIACLRTDVPRTRQRWLAVLVGILLSLCISVEMGFSFAAGVTAYAVVESWRQRSAHPLLLVLAAMGGTAFFFLAVGRSYLLMMREFSGGAYNLIVEPQPASLLFLFALVWLCPLLVRSGLAEGRRDASLFGALYVAGLALLPAAFGRADTGHILFNGMPIFLLALVAVSGWKVWAQRLWAGMVGLVLAVTLLTSLNLYIGFYKRVLAINLTHMIPAETREKLLHWYKPHDTGTWDSSIGHLGLETHLDVARVASLTGGAKVYVPVVLDPAIADQLEQSGLYEPGYFMLGLDVLDAREERAMLPSRTGANWVLAPADGIPILKTTPENSAADEGVPLPYKSRRTPFSVGVLLKEDLAQHFRPRDTFDGFTLYQRIP